jgi:hypothetical protein
VRGGLQFVKLLRQYGKAGLVEPVGHLSSLANMPEDTPEHLVYQAVLAYGPAVGRAMWAFLRSLPAGVGAASTAEFLVGHQPLTATPDRTMLMWDAWIKMFYEMAMVQEPAKPGDGSSIKYRQQLLDVVFGELDPFLSARIRFWLKESGAEEDQGYVTRYGRA